MFSRFFHAFNFPANSISYLVKLFISLLHKLFCLGVCLENKPKPLLTQQPDAEKVYIGELVSFKCDIKDSDSWEYFWSKDGKKWLFNNKHFDITHASLSDSGTYECMGIRNKTKYDSMKSNTRVLLISGESKELIYILSVNQLSLACSFLDYCTWTNDGFFLEIPSPKMKKMTPWLHVFPTESLVLSCEMNGSSDWTFMWYKDGQEIHNGQGVSFNQDATVLTINLASASHRGQYSCLGKHKQKSVSSNVTSGLQLDVYGEF